MKKLAVLLFLFILVSALARCIERTACAAAPTETLFVNARVVTMDSLLPIAQAFLVRDERIVWVGSDAEARAQYPKSRRVDLKNLVVFPGFNDAHTHLFSLGQSKLRLDLKGVRDEAEAVARVRARAASTPKDAWIRGWGWDDGAWASHYPSNRALSAASPNNPVYLQGLHSFAIWVNRKALEIAGITKSTPDPEKGQILHDPASGEPTGVLLGSAIGLAETKLPPPSEEETEHALMLAARECIAMGLTSVQEASVNTGMLAALQALVKRHAMPLRVYVMIDARDQDLLNRSLILGPVKDPNHHLSIRAIKIFADGALGSRGAVLFEPYSDRPGIRGEFSTTPEAIEQICRRALEAGFQVCTHAIGDRANHEVIEAYRRAFQAVKFDMNSRFRIEHAQVLSPSDIPRFVELGVIPSMQPTHCTSDMPWVEDRIGGSRALGAYAWRSLIDSGAHLPLSSDFPGETANPFYGIYAAVTRQSPDGKPGGGWHPEQKLRREEALRGYTVEAAYAEFEEKEKGTLAPGMLADFVVLSQNPADVPASALLRTRVLQTYVGGKLVYDSLGHGQPRARSGKNR